MKSIVQRVLLALLLAVGTSAGEPVTPSLPMAGCEVVNSAGETISPNHDALFQVLVAAPSCPKDVFELRAALSLEALSITPFLVSNHGFRHLRGDPGVRAMLFEEVTGKLGAREIATGEVFFGHFLGGPRADRLDALQAGDELLVEAIAWDVDKGVFNFYELTTENRKGWFYRGDSLDIARDLKMLYRGAVTSARLRCSGCHRNGGPIMKELSSPHNDWWTEARPLPLGDVTVEARVRPILADVADAARLADAVGAGMKKLTASSRYREALRRLSLPERLRPLFCPMELSLSSDSLPLTDTAEKVTIPPEFFVDTRLGGDAPAIDISKSSYRGALERSRSKLGDTSSQDSDHAWLAAVKDPSDRVAVEALVEEGLIDDEFVSDVLAVDMTAPVHSAARCGLLRFIPENETVEWKEKFREGLSAASSAGAGELLRNLREPERDARHHRERARALLSSCASALVEGERVDELFRLLQQRREEIRSSPLERSLEKGFRTVFPRPLVADFLPRPGSLRLDDACHVVPSQ